MPLVKKLKKDLKKDGKSLKQFLKKFDKKFIQEIEEICTPIEEKTWNKINCLDCGNCCKKMTPTFNKEDIRRISRHLNMTPTTFFNKWLKVEEDSKDVVNQVQPCQFLNPVDNKCSIYDVRPADCSGFPHFDKKDFGDYNHVYKQNLEFCPATFYFVKQLKKKIEKEYEW